MTDSTVTVVREWWPALVTLPGATENTGPAKVYLTEDDQGAAEVHVYVSDGGGPVLLLREPVSARSLASPSAPRSQPSTLTISEGDLLVFRAQGCGCSHPLKRWRPFGRYGQVAR